MLAVDRNMTCSVPIITGGNDDSSLTSHGAMMVIYDDEFALYGLGSELHSNANTPELYVKNIGKSISSLASYLYLLPMHVG